MYKNNNFLLTENKPFLNLPLSFKLSIFWSDEIRLTHNLLSDSRCNWIYELKGAFIFIGLLVDENNSPADGCDVFGWPLVYYTHTEAKMSVEPEMRTYFNQAYLIIDWLVTLLVSAGLIYGFKKLIGLMKKWTPT